MSDIPTESGGLPITGDVLTESGGTPVFVVEHNVPPPPARAGSLSALSVAARTALEPLTPGSAVLIPSSDIHCWLRAARKLGKKTAVRTIKGSVPQQTRIHIV